VLTVPAPAASEKKKKAHQNHLHLPNRSQAYTKESAGSIERSRSKVIVSPLRKTEVRAGQWRGPRS